MNETKQQAICDEYGAEYSPPPVGSRVGIALQTLQLRPFNGLRIAPEGSTCGWYLWGGGEPSNDKDFYQPLCVEHLAEHCPDAVPFLAMPPGWRFLKDGDYLDIWYDPTLRAGREKAGPSFVEVFIELLPTEQGGRKTSIHLSNDVPTHYRPHLRVRDGDGTYLGVEFVDGPDEPVLPGGWTYATVRFMYEPAVCYDALAVGVQFDVMEGGRIIGTGRVTRR